MVQFSRPKKSLAAAMDPFKRRETSAAEFLSKSESFFFSPFLLYFSVDGTAY